MRFFMAFLILVSGLASEGFTSQATQSQTSLPAKQSANVSGRWRVKFTLSGIGEKNLIFESQVRGSGWFRLLDTGPDNKPMPDPIAAAWSQTTNDRVSISGEVELPLGTCCREMGTLIFKGKIISTNSISGKAIFIGSTEDQENFNTFRTSLGTFTATRVFD